MNQYQSENITDLAKALLNVQRTVQPATKCAKNSGHYRPDLCF